MKSLILLCFTVFSVAVLGNSTEYEKCEDWDDKCSKEYIEYPSGYLDELQSGYSDELPTGYIDDDYSSDDGVVSKILGIALGFVFMLFGIAFTMMLCYGNSCNGQDYNSDNSYNIPYTHNNSNSSNTHQNHHNGNSFNTHRNYNNNHLYSTRLESEREIDNTLPAYNDVISSSPPPYSSIIKISSTEDISSSSSSSSSSINDNDNTQPPYPIPTYEESVDITINNNNNNNNNII